jgi:hypothetical protein
MKKAIIAGIGAFFLISPNLAAQQTSSGADRTVATVGQDRGAAPSARATGLDRLRQPVDPSIFDPTRITPDHGADTSSGGRNSVKAPVVAIAGDR